MRVFGIEPGDKFKEYILEPFHSNHEEALLENWLENNPDCILEDGKLLIIGRQVRTEFGSILDLLALDRQGDVVVVELKRDRTPRETLAQALEYAAFVEPLDTDALETILQLYLGDDSTNLALYHRAYFELRDDESVAFNKDQRIVIVGQKITNEVRKTACFLRSKGIRVTCVEFSFFLSGEGSRLLSQNIVVGQESMKPVRVESGSRPAISSNDFLQALDENGRVVFERILDFAKQKSWQIYWGSTGFSLRVELDGNPVSFLRGYSPTSYYKQTIYTNLNGNGSMRLKSSASEEAIQVLFIAAKATGLFQVANRELKCLIDRRFSEKEIESLLSWCEKAVLLIVESGLKE